MLLQLIDELDIGSPTNHRMVFRVLEDGNLFNCGNFNQTYWLNRPVVFPFFQVKKDEIVVLYFADGRQKTEKFVDGVCHFFYLGFN